MTGAEGLSGGIATHNLNILQAVVAISEQLGARLTVLSLLEGPEDRPSFLPHWAAFQGFRGQKYAFARALLAPALSSRLCIFDHVTLALPLLPLAMIRLARVVIFAHGSESWRAARRTSRWSFRFARLILANSNYTLRRMKERRIPGNILACPLGLSPSFALNEQIPRTSDASVELQAVDGTVRPLGEHVLLLVGRMLASERQKGHALLLEVLPTLAESVQTVQLVFAGPGEDAGFYAAQARRLQVDDRCFITGNVSLDLLKSLYQRCAAFAMPSQQEGFGLVYLEAMNYGKPCIGCFGDGAEDVIVHNETGILLRDCRSSDELAQAILTLLKDAAAAERMGRRGFERLHRHFTSAKVQARIREHLGAWL